MENKKPGDSRIALNKNSKIKLRKSKDSSYEETFRIRGRVGSGGSAICYLAKKDGKIGKLKEFYPADMKNDGLLYCLRRSKSNQLLPIGERMRFEFQLLRDDFIRTHETFLENKSDLLNNYTNDFELYYGYEDDTFCSVYMWVSDDYDGEIYSDALKKIHKSSKTPSEKLEKIVAIIKSLTRGVAALHGENFLHLDICPSNFKVKYSAKKEIGDSVDFFDLNSLYYIGQGVPLFKGQEGYSDPEISVNNASFQSDIYSIGAVLFSSLVLDKEKKGLLYSSEMYNKLDEVLSSSSFIKKFDKNKNVQAVFMIKKILVGIFEKCFAFKYDCCESLIDDLVLLGDYAVATKISVETADKATLSFDDINCISQNVLYKYPLYKYIPKKAKKFEILILGSDYYAFNFMDNCLQFAQVEGKGLSLTVLCDNVVTDESRYLSARPAITEFFTVNGKKCEGESYGEINFRKIPKTGKSRVDSTQKQALLEVLSQYSSAQYIFVSLGNDNLNEAVGKLCALHFGKNVFVGYAAFQDKVAQGSALPVFYDGTRKETTVDEQVERMAFNTHKIWEGSFKDTADTEFRKKNNYDSSVAFALSIKYKLWYVGAGEYTHLDEKSFQKTAKNFYDILMSDTSSTLFRNLCAMEHRRWVVQKITSGWTNMKNEDGELSFKGILQRQRVSDYERKKHPCLVKSTKSNPLSLFNPESDETNPWTDETGDESLDELDLVSVKLQRFFLKSMEDIDLTEIDKELKTIVSEISKDAVLAYNKFYFCIMSICKDLNLKYALQYDHYEKKLINELKDAFPDQKALKAKFKEIRKILFPAINACYFKNYKDNDAKLIKRIPFILTYRQDFNVALPFKFSTKQEVLGNVSAITVIRPKRVVFFVNFDINKDKKDLFTAAEALKDYINKRDFSVEMEFLFAATGSKNEAEDKETLTKAFEEIFGKKAKNKYVLNFVENEEQVAKTFSDRLDENIDFYDGTYSPFASSLQNYRFINSILESSKEIGYFEFDTKALKFTNTTNCEFLNFIEIQAYLRIEDIFALGGISDIESENMEYGNDYNILWEIYSGIRTNCKGTPEERMSAGVSCWNDFCSLLENHHNNVEVLKKNTLPSFNISKAPDREFEKLEYSVPSSSGKAYKKIISYLIKQGVVTDKSKVLNATTDSCKVIIYPIYDVEKAFKKLSSNILYLADEKLVNVNTVGSIIYVSYNELTVVDLEVDKKFMSLLTQLSKHGFINNFCFSTCHDEKKQKISFAYSCERIKTLLTNAGKILEIYTYYECKKTGYFDDVACSCKINSSDEVENEFDLILTKGFRTMIVECKACKQLSQDYYHKLLSLTTQFGIHPVKVIVANTHSTNGTLSSANTVQALRGERMAIFTVSSFSEIKAIGATLKNIMSSVCDD